MAGPYLDTEATQREERDQGTIGRCGTRVVPASTNRHRRPPPMPGPIHRSGLAKRKAFEPSPGSEDPCRSSFSLSHFPASRLLSFLFLQVNQPAWRTRNLLANYPCTTWTNLTRVLPPDPFRILCLYVSFSRNTSFFISNLFSSSFFFFFFLIRWIEKKPHHLSPKQVISLSQIHNI